MTQNSINQSLTPYAVPVASSDGFSLGDVTLDNGQTLIGSTGNAPQAAALTAGTNVTITNASNSITVAASGSNGSSVTQVKMTVITSATTYAFSPKMVAVRIDVCSAGGSVPGLSALVASAGGGFASNYNCYGCGADGGTYARVFATKAIGTAIEIDPGAANAQAIGTHEVPDNIAPYFTPPPANLAQNYAGGDATVKFLGDSGVVATLTCPGGAGARLTCSLPFTPYGFGASVLYPNPGFRWPRAALPTLTTDGVRPVKIVVVGASQQGQPGVHQQLAPPPGSGEGARLTGAGGGSYFSKTGSNGNTQKGQGFSLPSANVPYGTGNRAIGRSDIPSPGNIGQQAPQGGIALIYEYITD